MRKLTTRGVALLAALISLGEARAQAPLGGEFQVNELVTGQAFSGAVAMATDGSFVVVWRGAVSAGTDTDGSSIQARRYDPAGSALGAQFQVNSCDDRSAEQSGRGHRPRRRVCRRLEQPEPRREATPAARASRRSATTRTATRSESVPGQQLHHRHSDRSICRVRADRGVRGRLDERGFGGRGYVAREHPGAAVRHRGRSARRRFPGERYTTGRQQWPQVGVDGAGAFVIAWESASSRIPEHRATRCSHAASAAPVSRPPRTSR